MITDNEKYKHLEKCINKPVTILPSVWRKGNELSKHILGKKNFAGIVTYLIVKEYNSLFNDSNVTNNDKKE